VKTSKINNLDVVDKNFMELLNNMIKNYLISVDSFRSASAPFGGLPRHQLARIDPVMFMSGPKTAGAKPTVATFPICIAKPDASPPFCIPHSNAMVRRSCSGILNNHAAP
jgi:hypothetical protein